MQAHHRGFSMIVGIAAAMAAGVPLGLRALGADTDSLTRLPVYPGAPFIEKIPDADYCGSQMRSNMYMPDGKDATYVSWYDAHLAGFKRYHFARYNRPQDIYFKPDGTMDVVITGSVGTSDVYAITYETFKPALSTNAMASLSQTQRTCR